MNKEVECVNVADLIEIIENGDIPVITGHQWLYLDNENTKNARKIIVKGDDVPVTLVDEFRLPIEVIDSQDVRVEGMYGCQSKITVKNSSLTIKCYDDFKLTLSAKNNSSVGIKVCNGEDCKIKVKKDKTSHIFALSGENIIKGDFHSIRLPEVWCEYHNVEIINGIALLGKRVGFGYLSECCNEITGIHVDYTPGTIPVADDWDGGERECGLGLHFSPDVKMAKDFYARSGAHKLICPVKLTDMVIHPEGAYPQKCKAKGCCEPVWEVDDKWEPIDEANKKIRDAFYAKHS